MKTPDQVANRSLNNNDSSTNPIDNNKKTPLTKAEVLSRLTPEGKTALENIDFETYALDTMGGRGIKAARKQDLLNAEIVISKDAEKLLEEIEDRLVPSQSKFNLIRVKLKDLGFSNDAGINAVYSKAESFGLKILPQYTAPNFRLHYKDQPKDDYVCVATDLIKPQGLWPSIFFLAHTADGRVALSSTSAADEEGMIKTSFEPKMSFVFGVE